MWTTASIRRQLARQNSNKPFSIRQFLIHGSRSAVDRAFSRLVTNGEIIRVARGLYIKRNAPMPSVLDVALAKAAAFKRVIAKHGSTAAVALKLSEATQDEHIFACSGRTSSFRFGNLIIRLIGTSARKMHLGDSPSGLVVRALWYLGKRSCSIYTASLAVASFGRTDREEFRRNIDLVPAWMRYQFLLIQAYWQERQRQEFSRSSLILED